MYMEWFFRGMIFAFWPRLVAIVGPDPQFPPPIPLPIPPPGRPDPMPPPPPPWLSPGQSGLVQQRSLWFLAWF